MDLIQNFYVLTTLSNPTKLNCKSLQIFQKAREIVFLLLEEEEFLLEEEDRWTLLGKEKSYLSIQPENRFFFLPSTLQNSLFWKIFAISEKCSQFSSLTL